MAGAPIHSAQNQPAPPELDLNGEEDYYMLQARLNPIDNRTGRRTRRRASPGPPSRTTGGADLELLASITPDQLPITEGIPQYRMTAIAVPLPAVPVVPALYPSPVLQARMDDQAGDRPQALLRFQAGAGMVPEVGGVQRSWQSRSDAQAQMVQRGQVGPRLVVEAHAIRRAQTGPAAGSGDQAVQRVEAETERGRRQTRTVVSPGQLSLGRTGGTPAVSEVSRRKAMILKKQARPTETFKDLYSHFTLGRFMARVEKSYPGWSIAKPDKVMPDGVLRPAVEQQMKVIESLKCELCHVYNLANCYACSFTGHLICYECLMEIPHEVKGRHIDFYCPLCPPLLPEHAVIGGQRIPDWTKFLDELEFKCDFVKHGCDEVSLLRKHLNHIKVCPKVWRCLYCPETIPLTEMIRHLCSHEIRREDSFHNASGTMGCWKLELDAPFPGALILLEPHPNHYTKRPNKIKMDVKQFRISSVGKFLLYQIKTGSARYHWFVVFEGNQKEAERYEAKFCITANFANPVDAKSEVFVKRVCVSKVYPWNFDIKKTLREVSNDHDGLVAHFNYDLAEVVARNKALDSLSLKRKGKDSSKPVFTSKLEMTVGRIDQLRKPKYKRLFFTFARIFDKSSPA